MSRSTRLLVLLQALRGRRHPVTAALLAAELDVSERTIYRDIASLIASGAPIRGEGGVGYVLQSGLFLPPLMLSEGEIDALLLGLSYVDQRGDTVLRQAAEEVRAKIITIDLTFKTLHDNIKKRNGLFSIAIMLCIHDFFPMRSTIFTGFI